jgi:argininosuccinate lyase
VKLWQKTKDSLESVTRFTAGKDVEMDMYLAPFDVLGSLAHITMLESVALLKADELKILSTELKSIYKEILAGKFTIETGVEDIHSQIEMTLTKRLGEVGKKIHSGRSRNDQVLVDIKLFLRAEIQSLTTEIKNLFDLLIAKSEEHKDKLLPGYTHFQMAMPSSFGLWFGAYAESLVDDLITLQSAYRIVNKNPLGSAAGYGSSFPLNRKLTTELLGFEDLNYNVVYAQMGRGKTERIVAQALGNVAATVGKMAMDLVLYLNPNFSFVSFPDELTTGSSIMPHKKNPDVLEIIRARCNQLQALANDVTISTTNLPSGYHRDMQVLKEIIFPAFQTLKDCIQMAGLMLTNIQVKENLLADEKYQYIFSVEEVNKLVLQGVPFRDAYKQVGHLIEEGSFRADTNIKHTHEGSIGNLCNTEIINNLNKVLIDFRFSQTQAVIVKLVS